MHPKLIVSRERMNGIYGGCSVKAAFTPFQFHSNVELYLVEEGEADVWVGHKHKHICSGEMAVVLSYEAHQYAPSDDAVVTYIVVPADMCGELKGRYPAYPFVDDSELFSQIKSCCRAALGRSNAMLTEGSIRMAFGLLLEKLDFEGSRKHTDTGTMTRVLLYMHDNFRNDISLASAAGALGFNASYLSRCFKESLGIGFNYYLTMLRLREAVILLAKGHQADYCAFESGFNSLRTFYRAFRREFECTPREYTGLGK